MTAVVSNIDGSTYVVPPSSAISVRVITVAYSVVTSVYNKRLADSLLAGLESSSSACPRAFIVIAVTSGEAGVTGSSLGVMLIRVAECSCAGYAIPATASAASTDASTRLMLLIASVCRPVCAFDAS